jgi:rSAM/selenodomain-associated transferase 1
MKSSAPRADAARVAVFAKAPIAGHVKTRLAAVLGADRAADLHADLVRHALATAAQSGIGPVELWCAPDEAHPFFARCAAETGASLHRQRGADLGERMAAAFESAFTANRRLVLIGSDCPALTPRHLQAAAAALASHDAVFAPAEDGGYVLVALSRAIPGVFERIEWGGAGVMAATRERLLEVRARWHEMPPLWDVDRPDDYARLRREGLLQEMST